MSSLNTASPFEQYQAALKRLNAKTGDDRDEMIVFLWKQCSTLIEQTLMLKAEVEDLSAGITKVDINATNDAANAVDALFDKFKLQENKIIQ